MRIKTNINGIEAEIEKPSIVSGSNGTGKTSVLSSVEIGLYGTHYGVRPKVKGEVEFESEYTDKAKEYPLADIINCRFLDLEPIKKKQLLLQLIDNKSIQAEFGEHWKGGIQDSIDYVKDRLKDIKKEIKTAETSIEIRSKMKADKEELLSKYADNYDIEFEFVNTKEMVDKINTCKNTLTDIVKQGKQCNVDKCMSCGGDIKIDESKKKSLKARYHLLTQDLEEYNKELKAMEEYNETGKQIQENIKLETEKKSLTVDIKKLDGDIEAIINQLSKLQDDDILRLEEYVKKGIYSEIGNQLKIEGFEIDLSKNFEIKYNGKDYREMSRGQKYTANIYFSIGILTMLNAKIIICDDFECIDVDTRQQILKDIEGFDYLVGIVSDKELTY